MGVRCFLDTNIFVYGWDDYEPTKQQKALELIRSVAEQRTGVVSYQVIQEFFNVVLAKQIERNMSSEDAQQFLATVFRPLLAVHSSVALFGDAILIRNRYLLSWYDCLIVAAAQYANCEVLYSEDLQHGQRFGDLVVQNPFR